MANPITWRNVNAPSNAAALNLLQQAGTALGSSISDAGTALQRGAQQHADALTQDFIAELNATPDEATRQQMIQEASNAFIDLNKASAANRGILDRERTEERYQRGEQARQGLQGILSAVNQGNLNEALNLRNQLGEQGVFLNEGQTQAFNNAIQPYLNRADVSQYVLDLDKDLGQLNGNIEQIKNNIRKEQPDLDEKSVNKLANKKIQQLKDNYTLSDIKRIKSNIKNNIRKQYPNLDENSINRLAGRVYEESSVLSSAQTTADINQQISSTQTKSNLERIQNTLNLQNRLQSVKESGQRTKLQKQFLRSIPGLDKNSVDSGEINEAVKSLNKLINKRFPKGSLELKNEAFNYLAGLLETDSDDPDSFTNDIKMPGVGLFGSKEIEDVSVDDIKKILLNAGIGVE